MTLDEKDVKTLVPPMGLARKILRLLPKVFIEYSRLIGNTQNVFSL